MGEKDGFERAIVDPITVAICGRVVSSAISGNSNFKSRFRDYSAGNESVRKRKRRKKEEKERRRGKKEEAKWKRKQGIRDRW